MQLELFPEMKFAGQSETLAESSRKLVGRLLALRKELSEPEKDFLPAINTLIDQTRALSRYTPSQIEEKILYSIEKNQARHSEDISGDLKLDQQFIKKKILEMEKKGLVRRVRRHVPGMFKPSYMVKSNRIYEPDGD